MHLRPRFVATHLLLLSCVAFGVAMRPQLAPVQGQDGGDDPVKDGKWLYTRNCSGCHNDNGDGRGATILALGLTARDFKQGGFAFGDSREAITRTVNTGIPGRSPMPSFKGILKDEEIALVVDYVRTLMPPRKDEAPKNTEMIVKDRPVIARGKLPPLVEGGKDIPRGLLIGTPEGMTFEYDVSDVKLLGVRLGGFADREDWSDRGGGYLKPLGTLIWDCSVDSTAFVPISMSDKLILDARCELTGTWIRGRQCGLTMAVFNRAHTERLLVVDETVRTQILSVGPAITRSWSISVVGTEEVRTTAHGAIVRVAGGGSTPWSCGTDREFKRTHWWIRDTGVTGIDAVYVRPASGDPGALGQTVVPALAESRGGRLELEVRYGRNPSVVLAITRVVVPKWSTELGEKLAKELGQ